MSRLCEYHLGSDLYPSQPGFKQLGTAAEAAHAIAPGTQALRNAVMRQIRESQAGLTADEVAASLGRSALAIRPRLSELRSEGKIIAAGRTQRRRNASGQWANVWIAR